ncbi:hypothetical protein ECEC1866_1653, partial [Escherichia coli EC1866]
KIPPMAGF